MATAKTTVGTRTGKTFIVLTMGPKEAGSLRAVLAAASIGNKLTDNVVDALADVAGSTADYYITPPALTEADAA
jgi:hypothetical protein